MKRFLSLLATLVLLGQSLMTSVVYAQETINEESAPDVTVETVAEADDDNGANDNTAPELAPAADQESAGDDADEVDLSEEVEEPTEEEVVAEEPAVETPADEEVAQEPGADTPVVEEPTVEPVVEPEIPAEPEDASLTKEGDHEVVEDLPAAPAEDVAPVEEEKVEESEDVSYGKTLETVISHTNTYNGWAGGLFVYVEDLLGGLPAGTEMQLRPVEEDEIIELIDGSLEAKVTKVVAVDITFKYNGEEIEPTQPINVKIVAGNMPEAQTVVHIDNDDNVEEISADIKGKLVEFESDSFSIYAIVQTARLTVNLYNGGAEPKAIYLKSESEITGAKSLIYDPGIENLGDKVFRGWIAENSGYTAEDVNDALTIENIRTKALEKFNELSSGDTATLNYYAMIFNQYTVTYFNQYTPAAVMGTEEALYRDGETPSFTVGVDYVAGEDEYFEGWKDADGNTYQLGSGINLTGDLTLTAFVKYGKWLVFDENGKGAKYNAPQFVERGTVTQEPNRDEMVRNGYTFKGWYEAQSFDGSGNALTGDDGEVLLQSEPFDFGHPLDEKTTLFAKWQSETEARYTIIIRKQNIAGDGYDFVESMSGTAAVGSTINVSSAIARTYNGFHIGAYSENVTIKAEGDSVAHVFYDRDNITLNFYTYTYDYNYTPTESTNNNTYYYGRVNDGYVQLTRAGNGGNRYWTYNGERYDGIRYTRSNNKHNDWHLYKTMQGLYESTLESNGYTWPTSNNWYDKNNCTSYGVTCTRTTFLEAFIIPNGANSEDYYGYSINGTNTIIFYQQIVGSDQYLEVNRVSAGDGAFQISDKYSGFKPHHYKVDGGNLIELGDKDSNGYYASVDYDTLLEIYFNRLNYNITFMDGVYVDGNNNPIEQTKQPEFKTIQNIAFGSDLTSYNKGNSNYFEPEAPEGYVFEGWYIDDACTHPYTFTTMSHGGVTVYAKWRQIQYRVFLHPNVPESDTSLDWGSENQAMNFRISYLGKVSLPEGTRDGYTFAGWFTDSELKNAFNGDTRLTEQLEGLGDYNKKTDFTDPMNKYGNGATWNSDVQDDNGNARDRFRITQKLDLYAKWRSTLSGAEGINVVYQYYNGTGKDSKMYTDSAEALAPAAPTEAPENEQFKYWKVGKSETIVYPGETFSVLLSDATGRKLSEEEINNPEITMEYTVTVTAVYGDIEKAETTTIEYYDGGELFHTRTGNANEEFTFEAAPEAKSGYIFSGWRASDNKLYKPGTTGYAADNVGVEESKINRLDAVWDCDTAYHSEDEGETCEPNEQQKTCIPVTVENGYYVETGVMATWENGKWNVPECTEIQCNDHYILSGGVCVLASHTLTINYVYAEDNSEAAPTYTGTFNYNSGYSVDSPVITGYTTDMLVVTGTMGDNDVEVTVTYTKDNSQTQPTSYTVNHVVEGATRDTKDYTGTAWINDNPAMIAIVEGSLAQNIYTGYVYVSTSIPEGTTGVVNGTTIILTYEKDETQTKDLSYTVEYYKGNEKVENDTITVTKSVWVNDTTNTLEVQPIDTGDNKYTGYSFDRTYPETVLPTVESGTIIKVYYKINQYTITFVLDNGDDNVVITDDYGTGITAPTGFTKQGYTFAGWDEEVPATIPAQNMTITAQWNSATGTAYTVKYYKQRVDSTEYDNYQTDNLSGTTNETATVEPGTIEGFTLNSEKSKLSGNIEPDGSLVLEVYYDRVESTITIDPNCDDEGSDACGEPTVTTGSYEQEVELKGGTRSYTLSYKVGEGAPAVTQQEVTATIIGYCKGDSDDCAESERKTPGDKVQIEAEDVVYTAVWSGDLTVTVADGSDYQTASTGYTFVRWMDGETQVAAGAPLTLSGSKTLVAKYSEEARKYTITFVDYDGNELQSGELVYGAMPAYEGEPTRVADNTYTYKFAGWNPEITSVTGPQVYTATYSSTFIEYTVTFVDYDDNVIKTITGHYNEEITAPADPVREGYDFNGWTPTFENRITGDKTYKATYFEDKNNNDIDDSTEPHFTVEFFPGNNGTLSGTTKYENILSGLTFEQARITVPTINPNENYKVKTEYEGWDKALVTTVTATGEYTAQYFADFNDNNVDDETELVAVTFNAGTHLKVNDAESYTTDQNLLPGYSQYPDEPSVTADEGYAFSGWNPIYTAGGDIELTNPVLRFVAEPKCAPNYHDKALETPASDNDENIQKPLEREATALECVSDTQEGMACEEGNKPEHSHFDSKTGTGTWNGTDYDVVCPWSCDSGWHKNSAGTACEQDKTPGGGGGSGGGTYSCRNLPANAEANNDKLPGSSTSYSYDPDSTAACTFHCKSGYHRDGQACVAGGGGGSDEEEIELGGQVSDKCSVEGSDRSPEEIAAYLYACENDITTIRDINEARLGDYLNRAEMAKIISVFATKELGMKPNTSKDCSNFAESIESRSQEMKDYMVMSCQLELMGIHTVNYEPIPDFMPAKRVSRAEFGTILSRVLWGNTYEGTNENYYFRHLDALKASNIITNIDPNITEYRAWVLLMVYRSVEIIKSGKATPRTSIEEQVNEELENGTGTTIGMPNPASVYCEEQGGTVDLDTSKCKLADGTEVDQWEYYNANNKSEEETQELDAETTTGDVVEG